MPESVAEQPAKTRSILTAAERVRVIEQRRLLYSDAEISLTDAFKQQYGTHFCPIRVTRPMAHYSLRNVVLDANTMALQQDGLTIAETAMDGMPVPNRHFAAGP